MIFGAKPLAPFNRDSPYLICGGVARFGCAFLSKGLSLLNCANGAGGRAVQTGGINRDSPYLMHESAVPHGYEILGEGLSLFISPVCGRVTA
jgi:hypothetical protein